jgi:L-ascorbate metabolism protein UlaG (beta-lactamase superfamily)
MEDILKNRNWFSQGALKFTYNGKIIYTDPFDIDHPYHDADFIFLTHPHFDHISPENIDKVIKADTVFVTAESIANEIKAYGDHTIKKVNPGDKLICEGFEVEVMPAYNIVKTQCHAKEKKWVGYLFKFGATSVYYTSDTEYIPEMDKVNADIILLPLGQTYTMESVDEAVQAAKATKAKIAIPIHYGKYEGSKEDAEKFKKMAGKFAQVIDL